MTLTNPYCTLAALKLNIGITSATDTADDTMLERAINAASRWIDDKAGTRFYTTAADETRYYTHPGAHLYGQDNEVWLCHDDILSITTLKTDVDGDRTYSDTWAATDYDLLPYYGPPYTWIETTPTGNYTFPSYRRGIQIVGKFGYCTAATQPPEIEAACILIAQRWWKRKDAIFGVAGIADLGQIQLSIPTDPDVLALLSPYIERNRGPF